jgi:hypothetical protein
LPGPASPAQPSRELGQEACRDLIGVLVAGSNPDGQAIAPSQELQGLTPPQAPDGFQRALLGARTFSVGR